MVTLILRCCRWITQTSAGAVEITSWLLIFLYCVNLYVFSTSLPPDIAIRSSMNLFKVLLVPSLFTSSCVSGQRYSDGYRLRRLAALLNISSWPWYCLSWLCYLLDSGSVVQHDHSSLPLHPRDSGLNCDAYRCNPMHTRTDPIGVHLVCVVEGSQLEMKQKTSTCTYTSTLGWPCQKVSTYSPRFYASRVLV